MEIVTLYNPWHIHISRGVIGKRGRHSSMQGRWIMLQIQKTKINLENYRKGEVTTHALNMLYSKKLTNTSQSSSSLNFHSFIQPFLWIQIWVLEVNAQFSKFSNSSGFTVRTALCQMMELLEDLVKYHSIVFPVCKVLKLLFCCCSFLFYYFIRMDFKLCILESQTLMQY